jgi:hypothetical protein
MASNYSGKSCNIFAFHINTKYNVQRPFEFISPLEFGLLYLMPRVSALPVVYFDNETAKYQDSVFWGVALFYM